MVARTRLNITLYLHWLFLAFVFLFVCFDRLCDRGPGFDPRPYQIFWVVVGLERGTLSLVRSIEELLEWKK